MEASEEEVQFFVHATNPMCANQIRLEDYIQVTSRGRSRLVVFIELWGYSSFFVSLSLYASCITPASITLSLVSDDECTQGHRGSGNSEFAKVLSSGCLWLCCVHPEDSVCNFTALVLSL